MSLKLPGLLTLRAVTLLALAGLNCASLSGEDLVSLVRRDVSEVKSPSTVAFSYREVVRSAREGVVTVVVKSWERKTDSDGGLSFDWQAGTDRFDGRPRAQAAGSGIVLTADGLVLTNHHVIQGARKITLRAHGGKEEVDAVIVGSDAATDVALLRASSGKWHPSVLSDSAQAQPGDVVLAVGSPFGLENSVTMGIISATGRADLEGVGGILQDFIQTDAAIHPGNSGGPLVDGLGRVVGMNTARYGSENIGLAVPVNLALKVASDLFSLGRVQRGHLGIRLSNLGAETLDGLDLPPGFRGVAVTAVEAGSPADKGGVLPGDVLFSVNELAVTSADSLRVRMTSLKEGDKVRLGLLRAGELKNHEVVLGQPPDAGPTMKTIRVEILPGLIVEVVDKNWRNKLLLPERFQALRVMADYPPAGKGESKLAEGDLITHVNGSKFIASAKQVEQESELKFLSRVSVLLLTVLHQGEEKLVGISVPKQP
jgi:S1-C subfamily serine protease